MATKKRATATQKKQASPPKKRASPLKNKAPLNDNVEGLAAFALEILPAGGQRPGAHLADLAIYFVHRNELTLADAALSKISAEHDESEIAHLAHGAAYLARAGAIKAAAKHSTRARELRDSKGELYPDTAFAVDVWIRAAITLVTEQNGFAGFDPASVANVRNQQSGRYELAKAFALCGAWDRMLESLAGVTCRWDNCRELFELVVEAGDFDRIDAVSKTRDPSSTTNELGDCIVRQAVRTGQFERAWQSLEAIDLALTWKLLPAVFEKGGIEAVGRRMEPQYEAAVEKGNASDQWGWFVQAGKILGAWSKYDRTVVGRAVELLSLEKVDTSYGLRIDTEGMAAALARGGATKELKKVLDNASLSELCPILEMLDTDHPLWQAAYKHVSKPDTKSTSDWPGIFAALRSKPNVFKRTKEAYREAGMEFIQARDNDLFFRTIVFAEALAAGGDWAGVDEIRAALPKARRRWLVLPIVTRAFSAGEIARAMEYLTDGGDGFSSGERQAEVMRALLENFSNVGARATS